MKKQVKCNNVGPCTRAGKVFVIDDEELQGMICPECGEPLEEVKETVAPPKDDEEEKKKRRIIAIIVVVLAALGIGGGIAYALLGGKAKPEGVTLNKQVIELVVGESESIQATVTPVEAAAEAILQWQADGNAVTVNG